LTIHAITPSEAKSYDRASPPRCTGSLLLWPSLLFLWAGRSEGPRSTPTRDLLLVLHPSVGLIMLATMLLRAGWRWRHPAPPLPVGLAPLDVALARCTHVLLYLIFIGMPIAGLVNAAAAGHSVSLFGVLSIPPLLPENDRLAAGDRPPPRRAKSDLFLCDPSCGRRAAACHRPPRRGARADAAASPIRLSRCWLRQKIAPSLALRAYSRQSPNVNDKILPKLQKSDISSQQNCCGRRGRFVRPRRPLGYHPTAFRGALRMSPFRRAAFAATLLPLRQHCSMASAHMGRWRKQATQLRRSNMSS
jgi:hypothetical protein